MLRLDYLFMRKGLLSLRDKCTSEGSKCYIKSFAFRDNNGIQPVPDDFPVALIEVGCTPGSKRALAKDINWESISCYASWEPDYDKLLEQQNEYDKQQAIESKESKMSEFTYGQKIYLKHNNEHDFTFGCYHIDGENVLFMYDTGYGRADIDDVKATPFKTELEIAKEYQLDVVCEMIESGIVHGMSCSEIAKVIQENGHLAEIILPSKDK